MTERNRYRDSAWFIRSEKSGAGDPDSGNGFTPDETADGRAADEEAQIN